MAPDDHTVLSTDLFGKMNKTRSGVATSALSRMPQAQIRTLLDSATVQRFDQNAVCFEQGSAADAFYLLIGGVMRIAQTTPEGEQVIVLHLVPGQMFGLAQAFENDTYHTTARAASDAVVLSWPAALWDRFSADYPGFLSASRRAVGERVDDMRQQVVTLATLQVEQRIAHAVLDLVTRTGQETAEGIEIGFPITRQDLSEMTGTTLHSVSRYLSKWQKSGIVTSKRRRIIVRAPQALPL